ncbi:MAG: S-layer homology domain-containing protein [Actinomycetota bacterium]|nr:S-layer homology domain-containing protein [Actinomycetota bacterium]
MMRGRRLAQSMLAASLLLGVLALTPLANANLDPGGTFTDDDESIHEAAIEAIAAEGITKGCNPPVNDRYCPSATVTREQMASFLVRALDLPPGTATFTDTSDSIHSDDIAALAEAGITKGCNPPDNTRYCPTSTVTREQMAAFLVRALGYTDDGDGDLFIDDNDSIFEADIDRLGTAGVTRGCNPPTNSRFCPKDPVTREQMASFLTRALHLDPIDPPPPLPDVSPSPLVVIGTENWLYFSETVDQSCLAYSVFDRAVVEAAKAKAVVEASGREFVYAIAPNKSSIYSETVPASAWTGSCADQNSDGLRAAFGGAADPARVELWDVFDAQAATRRLHFKHDTHWNGDGALLGSEHIAASAAPGVWAEMDIVPTPAARQGDLADLIGVPWVVTYGDPVPTLPGTTPTVTVESATIAGRPLVAYSSPGNPELSAVRTAVIHDSYGLFFRNKLGPLFENVTFVPNFSHPIPDAARPFVVSSDQIVLEVVERNLLRDFIGTGTAGHLAAALADDFAQTSVTYTRVEDEVQFTLLAAGASALRYLVVEVDATSTEVIGLFSDVDIPASEPAWPNEITPDASRYGFEIMGSPSTLALPLPPSVSVTSAFVIAVG